MLTWVGIVFCLSQSAIFSGLNLAYLSLSRLRLEIDAATGNPDAITVLNIRSKPNHVLTTVLVGNVGVNVMLTLLSESVLTGASAFLFSTVVITTMGELLPQAYFSRNALRIGARLSPIFHFYRMLLFPITRPLVWLLDRWLGVEGITYFRESEMRQLIRSHIDAKGADIGRVEGLGALNFLALDDLKVADAGQLLASNSIVTLPFDGDTPQFPDFAATRSNSFIMMIRASGKKWVVLQDPEGQPRLVLDTDAFLRDAAFAESEVNPLRYCHRPIIVFDTQCRLGELLSQWQTSQSLVNTEVLEDDLVLVWSEPYRVITGSDILGQLLYGIAEGSYSKGLHLPSKEEADIPTQDH